MPKVIDPETERKVRQAWQIAQETKQKITKAAIGKHYGVHSQTVSRILSSDAKDHGEIFAQVDGQYPAGVVKKHIASAPLPFVRAPGVEFNIGVLPDPQAKPGITFDYLRWAGLFFAHKKPNVILCGGDFADMPSLSFHDVPGSMGYEGKRYKADILAVHEAMKVFMTPILEEMKRTGWAPRFVMCLGNHEDRINRTIRATPKLDGVMGLPDLEYERWGWEVVPFLVPIIIEGVAFCHYFTSGVMGRPITTAQALITKKHMSCFAFHQQGRDVKHGYRGDGKEITGIICGSYYEHDEEYLNHQTNKHFRGLYMLYGVEDGEIESAVAVNLKYLKREYDGH